MIRTADGEFIPDIRGAASKSTGKRRIRVNKKSDSSTNNWRSGNIIHCQHKGSSTRPTTHKGHWGFSSKTSEINSTPKNQGEIESLTDANRNLVPYLAFNLIIFATTPKECQELIDRINTKCYDDMDPHMCSIDVPCSNTLKRVLDDGSPDYESGIHVCAIDVNMVQMTHEFSIHSHTNSIIIPSWHKDLLDTWNCEDKSKGIPYPINGFDLSVMRDIHIIKYINSLSCYLKNGEKLYVMANIFGGDDPSQKNKLNHFYDINIQLIRGHVEHKDEKKAGIDIHTKSKKMSKSKLEAAGKFAAIRETFEETDKCIIISSEMAAKMKVIYDFQQPTKEGGYNRGIVFGFNHPIDVTMLLNMNRVVI
jgi:hypothetical protein